MDASEILIWIIVGAIAGWLAGLVVRGAGFGLLGDIVVGIVGAFISGLLLPRLGVHLGVGFVGAVIDAFIGAVILLLLLRLVRRV
ncbi:GlsB/YeaQ/YmgE family stress response membrane protein [Lichenifustis flavocetrariae]|uniref:GlsB/YeaQ/YmgE family stress response membrane protein n=1 Tax=Lichenifustis flavocetrariae TaxID=2949735 RepID=A0AA41YS06_9HYPH|nr:GlsB/YeaQ/YmgE family stress response membrane protein [Lichenifustis flavocetrariae]MCW6507499.1 GlsB/YeaQ/YmgE family stress response membrane protein [Lichenifustis flavocetrariae]